MTGHGEGRPAMTEGSTIGLRDFLLDNGADDDGHFLARYPPWPQRIGTTVYVLIPRGDLEGRMTLPPLEEATARYPHYRITVEAASVAGGQP